MEEKGFDAAVTAGAVHDLLWDAIEVVPGVTELNLVEMLAEWRPGTPTTPAPVTLRYISGDRCRALVGEVPAQRGDSSR